MNTNQTNNRIAKNTVFLYIRMIVVMLITLFTSRVVLRVLGIVDYGIYNVVAGLATSFIFFSSSLSNATQRFLNFELGKKDIKSANKVFNLNFLVYISLSVFFIIAIESIGLWFLNTKMNIPLLRKDAANWVLQTFVISLSINFIGTVYDSVLIARENMKIYAYTGLFDAILKLIIVYLLLLATIDRLVFYSILLMVETLIIRLFLAVYCKTQYPECQIILYWNKQKFFEMFRFIGWNGVGTAVWAINEQGMNILMNIFFGPVINAAKAISSQVTNTVNNFCNSFNIAISPQIVKSYAAKDIDKFYNLIFVGSRISFYLMWIVALPLILRTNYVLKIWLGNYPAYSDKFIDWVLIYNLINVLTNPFWYGIQAIGILKNYILIGSFVYLLAFPISFIFLKLGFSPLLPFQVLVLIRLVYLVVIILIVKSYENFSLKKYLYSVIYPIIKVLLVCLLICIPINNIISQDVSGLCIMLFFCFGTTALAVYLLGLQKNEKELLKMKILRHHV